MDPYKSSKPLPVLAHMPPHIKMKIAGNLDYFDQISLRNSSRDFRLAIRPPPIVASVKIIHNMDHEARVKFICEEHGFSKKKKYGKNEQGWMMRTSYKSNHLRYESEAQRRDNLLEMMIQDFKSILATPMLTLRSFTFYCTKSEEFGIMPRIKDILSSLKQMLKVEKLTFGNDKKEEILGILPFVNPDVLKCLETCKDMWTDEAEDGPPYGIRVLELHRFPNLERLDLNNLTDILPVEIWWNIPSTYIGMGDNCSSPESLAQLQRILQHFRQTPGLSSQEVCLNDCDMDIKQALGPVGPFTSNGFFPRFHLPAEGSNLDVYGIVCFKSVSLSREDPRVRNDEEEADNDSDID